MTIEDIQTGKTLYQGLPQIEAPQSRPVPRIKSAPDTLPARVTQSTPWSRITRGVGDIWEGVKSGVQETAIGATETVRDVKRGVVDAVAGTQEAISDVQKGIQASIAAAKQGAVRGVRAAVQTVYPDYSFQTAISNFIEQKIESKQPVTKETITEVLALIPPTLGSLTQDNEEQVELALQYFITPYMEKISNATLLNNARDAWKEFAKGKIGTETRNKIWKKSWNIESLHEKFGG
jgi:hypothetical protein